jgi:hypothetical protein
MTNKTGKNVNLKKSRGKLYEKTKEEQVGWLLLTTCL